MTQVPDNREAAVLRAAARSGRTRRVEAGPAELSLRRFAPAPAMADVEPLEFQQV